MLLSLTFAQLALAIVYTVEGFRTTSLILDRPTQKTIANLALGAGVVTDISTALALCYYLRKLRTGYSSSDTMVTTLIRYAVNCGVLTSAFSLVTLVTNDALPRTFVPIAFLFLLSKMYPVSFMATLNTRMNVRGRGTDNEQPYSRNTFYMYGQSTPTSNTQDNNLPCSPDELCLKVDVRREVTIKSEVVRVQPCSTS